MTPLERFLDKIEFDDNGCWLWIGAVSTTGYGNFWAVGRYVSAHKWSYTFFVGPVPDGLDLDHFACDTRRCCCPDHVRPATRRENTLRGNTRPSDNVAKTHCPEGHPYTPENTYIQTTGRGGRSCRICRKASNDRLTERRRARRLEVA